LVKFKVGKKNKGRSRRLKWLLAFFFTLLVLIAAYYGLKLYVFHKINSLLTHKIEFKNLEFSVLPPAITIRDIKDFTIKDKNIVSFKEISAEVPFLSLFSKVKTVDIYIHKPRIIFDNSLLKKGKKRASPGAFKINKVNIIDGQLVFNAPKFHADLLKFDLKSFSRGPDTIYRLTSPHLKAVFPVSREPVTLEGQMLAEFREQEQGWKVSKFYWETRYAKINVNGRFFKNGRIALNAYSQGSPRQITEPLLDDLAIREFMYGSARISRSRDGLVSIEGTFDFNAFTINGEAFKDLGGRVSWDNKSKNFRVFVSFHDDRLTTRGSIIQDGKWVHVTASDISAAKIIRIIRIDDAVPLGGVLKKGKVAVKGRFFKGAAQLEQDPGDLADPLRFNAAGKVEFTYNSKEKAASFSSRQIQAEFGRIDNLTGSVAPKKENQLAVNFNASVNEAAYLDKYTRHYINMDLDRWDLKKGDSTINLDVKKIGDVLFVESDILLRNFYSGGENIQWLSGHVSTRGDVTRGKLSINDKDLKGDARFIMDSSAGKDLKIHFDRVRGQSKKLLNILGVDLSLTGRMSGDFTYTDKTGMPASRVQGSFKAARVNFYDFDFENISGQLDYSDSVTLENLAFNYMDGSGGGNVFINYDTRQFAVDGKIVAIDLQRMNNRFTGRGDIFFKGKGAFDKDPILFNYQSGDIYFFTDQFFFFFFEGKILTDFSSYRLETGGKILDRESVSPYTLRLTREEGQFGGDFQADIADINLLIPWGNNKGRMKINGQILTRANGKTRVEGHAAFDGKVLAFPNFPHALKNFSGDMIFTDLKFNLRSLQGKMGEGNVDVTGSLIIEQNRLETLRLLLTGRNMTLFPMDRTTFTLDADLELEYLNARDKLLLTGDLELISGLWEREIDEGINFNTNPSLSASSSSIMDMLEFDLNLVNKGDFQFSNAIGWGSGDFDLRLTGDIDFPVLRGTIEARGGKINFSGKTFDIIRGKLNFNDKFQNDPLINIESEAFIKNYRIKFAITGSASQPKPELQSSPPLPPRDILTLIAVGELFRRPTSSELSSQFGTGTTDLIASELTEQIKKRTKKIFGNYMLRIDPNISNITGTSVDASRLIVGKEISRDFLIVYSTDFSTKRQEVVYLQYQLSPSISLIGMRNEEGRISIDIRFRKRHQ
jgi:hypothetical protein